MLAFFLHYRKAIFLLLIVLLGLAGGQLAGTLVQLRGAGESPRTPTLPPVEPRAGRADPTGELAFILQHHPFDAASRSAAPVSFTLAPPGAPQGAAPAGDLELRGTLVAGKRSLALIRSGQETRLYRLGEELPGGGTLAEVSRHEVKIRGTGSALTTLPLFEGAPAAAAGGAATPTAPGKLSGGALRSAGPNRWVIPRREVEAIRDNFSEQLGMALMQPHTVNGRTDGFVIKRIAPGALLSKMGLIRGDIVKQVNEMTIDSPEKALQILQQLREARQLAVTIERNGTPLVFNYEID